MAIMKVSGLGREGWRTLSVGQGELAGYRAEVLADSISEAGIRLTTLGLRYPRFVHAELKTHRVFSSNSASSRAIPLSKTLVLVRENPVRPVHWGANQKGMQASAELQGWRRVLAKCLWYQSRYMMLVVVWLLGKLGLHKQLANRLLEPWLWIETIVTATEWDNFFALRVHKDAQPELCYVASLMQEALQASTPRLVQVGDWHLPLCPDRYDLMADGYSFIDIVRIVVGRCARVSYLTHFGTRDPKADLKLCANLLQDGHMSPAEHVATPLVDCDLPCDTGNFRGWLQFRKTIPHEANFAQLQARG